MEIKTIVVRLLDLLAIALLVLGSQDAQTFVAVLVWGMVVLAVVGLLAMDEKLAKELQDAPTWRLCVAWAFHLAYAVALIMSGRPALAACYLIAVVFLRFAAAAKLKEAAK
jgi:uncharacterized membrane protein HdeD (DUF308 family)